MQVVSAPVLKSWALRSDDQVVSRVVAGQIALFEVLMRRYNERLYRAARAIVKDESEAENVMHQAYVHAYSRLRQLDGREPFPTWLTRIAVNEALARARRRGRYITMDPEHVSALEFPTLATPPPNCERLALSRELCSLIEPAIDRLPDGRREVFILRQVEGMDTSEVADVLGISEVDVKTRLSRACASLRRELYAHANAATPNTFRFSHSRGDRVVSAVLGRIL